MRALVLAAFALTACGRREQARAVQRESAVTSARPADAHSDVQYAQPPEGKPWLLIDAGPFQNVVQVGVLTKHVRTFLAHKPWLGWGELEIDKVRPSALPPFVRFDNPNGGEVLDLPKFFPMFLLGRSGEPSVAIADWGPTGFHKWTSHGWQTVMEGVTTGVDDAILGKDGMWVLLCGRGAGCPRQADVPVVPFRKGSRPPSDKGLFRFAEGASSTRALPPGFAPQGLFTDGNGNAYVWGTDRSETLVWTPLDETPLVGPTIVSGYEFGMFEPAMDGGFYLYVSRPNGSTSDRVLIHHRSNGTESKTPIANADPKTILWHVSPGGDVWLERANQLFTQRETANLRTCGCGSIEQVFTAFDKTFVRCEGKLCREP